MSVMLADDLTPDTVPAPLADSSSVFDLLVTLEHTGAMTPTALRLPDVDWDTYVAVGSFLGSINRRCAWFIGDWLRHGQEHFGDRFVQAAAITGLSEQTLLSRLFVSENVPESRRQEGVSFSCHAAVSRLPAKEQSRWLKAAASGAWSYAELRSRMKAARRDEKPMLPGAEPGDLDIDLIVEVAKAILRDAREAYDPAYHEVPTEDIVRLRAALGEE